MDCLLVLIVIVIEDNEIQPITKIRKENIISEFMLRDICGFAEHQEKATYGLGYNLTVTRKRDNFVLNKDNATNFG